LVDLCRILIVVRRYDYDPIGSKLIIRMTTTLHDTFAAELVTKIKCFGHHLSSDTIVKVDDNEQLETRDLAKRYLRGGYHAVRCRLGDFIFKRGDFSLESGYWDDDDGPTGSWDA
jgi:hypothetical protein